MTYGKTLCASRWRVAAAAGALWLLAVAQHFAIAPYLLKLPGDYAEDTHFEATGRLRTSLTQPWEESKANARRSDVTLVAFDGHSIIQSNMNWSTAAGETAFETASVYGVDRHTRENLPGYGDDDRTGQFFFPPDTAPRRYAWWDAQFLQAREAVYERSEVLGGMEVLVFHFQVAGIDESEGYGHLPEVPERYRAHTDGKGRAWVEPLSGTVVRYEEEGTSYFYDEKTRQRAGNFYIWNAAFARGSEEAKMKRAMDHRSRIRLLKVYLPAALVACGALLLAVAVVRWRRGSMGAAV